MPPHVRLWLVLVSALIFVTLAAMFGAWSWALGRLWSRQPLLPRARPRVVPWGVATVLVVIGLWLAVMSLARTYLDWTGTLGSQRAQIVVASLANGVLLVVIPLTLIGAAPASLNTFSTERPAVAPHVAAGTVGFLLATPLVYLVHWLSLHIWKQHKHPLEEMVVAYPTLGIACLALLSSMVLAPACEELVFRGILQRWLAQYFDRPRDKDKDTGDGHPEGAAVALDDRAKTKAGGRLGSLTPIVLTSALFAAIHAAQWPAPVAIFFLSLGLGVVYQRSGSLIASVVMHALFNGFSTLILFQTVLTGHPADPKLAPTATCVRVEGTDTAPATRRLPTATRGPSKTFIQARFSIGAGLGRG
jgi:membrane protease YdiL (CAAX protease family)